MKSARIASTLGLCLIYGFLLTLLRPDGFSILKAVITLFAWISLYQILLYFFNNREELKETFPGFIYAVILVLFFWNVASILRSGISDNISVMTLLGNQGTAMALLLPLIIAYSGSDETPFYLNRFLTGVLLLSLPLFLGMSFITIPFEREAVEWAFRSVYYCTVFMILFIPYNGLRVNVLVLISSLVLGYLSFRTGDRTMMLRLVLLLLILVYHRFYVRSGSRIMLSVAFSALLVPVLLIGYSIRNRESILTYVAEHYDSEISVDTRTFLYMEVFEDLELNNSLITGKGSNATYYSSYFASEEGDSSVRLSMEVGILAFLLKGGFIAVFLNLLILVTAISLALFRSENNFVKLVGLFLLSHAVLLFIENPVVFSIYNLVVWILAGICLSRRFREMDDDQINLLLLQGNEES